MSESTELSHYGTPRHSGRYPWGSGKDPQHSRDFLSYVQDLHKKGLSEKEIADGLGISTTALRARKAISKNEVRKENEAMALRLREKGMSAEAIGERMDIPSRTVYNLLEPSERQKKDVVQTTADMLEAKVAEKEYLDVGSGNEAHLGISATQLQHAVVQLQEQGYELRYIKVPQLGTADQFTTIKVLTKPGVPYSEVYKNRDKIQPIPSYSEDMGRTFLNIETPASVSSKRLTVKYGPDGGSEMDGVIELRRGVSDISLGNSKYAQVRIAVDGTHYLKGMAIYADDLPKGVDIRFNTNKSKTDNKLDALKALKDDPDNPFGAIIRQRHYTDANGKDKLSAINIVNEEGDWGKWSKTLSSQMLSKQTTVFAKQQLDRAYQAKKAEYDEILALTNPVVKKTLLQAYSDSCDSASNKLKAAGMPRQRTQVILPVKSMKETEIYAPNFRNGEEVVLVRHPHGGRFEIPSLKVNNKQPDAIKAFGNAKDAVGINAKVAARLSGADFDGDTVLVIPNRGKQIKTSAPLAGLMNFDPQRAYPAYDGMRTIDGGTYNAKTRKVIYDGKPKPLPKQQKMGDVSNLITDLTIKGANLDEIARAVRHSMVIIDSEKHHLNYKQSYVDNGIAQLKTKYQGSARSGASTLISRAKSPTLVPERTARKASEGGPIDISTGKKAYTLTGSSYTNEKGKVIFRTSKTTKMDAVEDAYSLSSGTPIEAVYATHANRLKSLANDARKTMIMTKDAPYSPSAKLAYATEVSSLKAKLNISKLNSPLERRAQILANSISETKIKNNPDYDKSEIKKIKSQALAAARARVGAKKVRVDISDAEWNAIQAGAISSNMLKDILANANLDRVKELATPHTNGVMSSSVLARAHSLMNSGYTRSEIADQLGVSVSTLIAGLEGSNG